MPIAGLQRNNLGRIEIKVFKGARKTQSRAGKSLEGKLRITCANKSIARILTRSYGAPDNNGDWIVDRLNIYLPYDDPDRNMDSSMKAYTASYLERVCDRQIISQIGDYYEDRNGKHRQMKPCSEPCPIAGTPFSVKCPYGCTPNGEFFFYIKEVLDADIMIPARLTAHSLLDISHILETQETFLRIYGALTASPFPCAQYRHHIPMCLTANPVQSKRPVLEQGKRSGKRADMVVYALGLSIDPSWVTLFQAWKAVQDAQAYGLRADTGTIAGLLSGRPPMEISYIDAQVVEPPKVLTPAPDQTIQKETWTKLLTLFKEHGWDIQTINTLLGERFGVSRGGELLESQVESLIAIAKDPAEKEYYLSVEEF